jgi:hypothetical protein
MAVSGYFADGTLQGIYGVFISARVPVYYQPSSGLFLPAELDSSNNLNVNVAAGGGSGGFGTLYSGQVTVNPTAALLPSQSGLHYVTLQSSYQNLGVTIYWGTSGAAYYEMAAGDVTAPIPIGNLDLISVKCTTADTALLNWWGA